MAMRCQICGKGGVVGRQVSYSKQRSPRRFLPNLRWAKIIEGGMVKKVKICMKCLKKLKKEGRAGPTIWQKIKKVKLDVESGDKES